MLGSPTRTTLKAGLLTLALGIGATAHGQGERLFSIPPGTLSGTALEWSYQAGIQVLFDSAAFATVRTRGVVGALSPLDALGAMLRDSPLTYAVVNRKTVAVVPGSQYCRPWIDPQYAPLPPCVPGLEGVRL